MQTCVSPLPVTSTFCPDGHRLSFFKSEYLTRLSHWSFSVSHLGRWSILYMYLLFLQSFLDDTFKSFSVPILWFSSGLQLCMCWFSFVWFLHLLFSFLWSPFSVPPSKSHAMLSASSMFCVCNIYFYDAFISMLLFFILKFDWPHFKSSIAPWRWQHSSRRWRLKAWSSVDSPLFSSAPIPEVFLGKPKALKRWESHSDSKTTSRVRRVSCRNNQSL